MQNEIQKRTCDSSSPGFPDLENSLAQLEAERAVIREAMNRKILKEGIHYGMPFGNKPSLLKPGAEVLARLFRLIAEDNQIEEHDLGSGHRNFTVRVHIIHNGAKVGFGIGSCATTESKYLRKKSKELSCPECGKPTLMISKKIEGTYFCNPYKGGCKETFDFDDGRLRGIEEPISVSTNPGDHYNTCLKMAKKRAFIDGVLTCTAASEIFTQDLEDFPDIFGGNQGNPEPGQPHHQKDRKTQAPAPGMSGNARHSVQNQRSARATGPKSGLMQLAQGEMIPRNYFDARDTFGKEEFQFLIGGSEFYTNKKGKDFYVARKTQGRFAGSRREAV